MAFDINAISEEDLARADETEVSSSEETKEVASEPTEAETTPAEGKTEEQDENPDVVAPESGSEPTPESKPSKEPKAETAKPLSRVERAEYSAAKWKKKFKQMKRERDEALAEFNKYKDFDPNQFENAQDAHEYMAWRASTAQRLQDMNDDLRSFYNEKRAEEYQSKIENCFNSQESVDNFNDLDDEYGEAFDVGCNMYDPDGVIRDFVNNSKLEPALKTVIYKNGQLQEDLFKDYGNPRINAVKRLQILEALERNVENYYRNLKAGTPAKVATPALAAKAPIPVQPKPTATVKRFSLPQKKVTPQVTGSLTKGNEVGEPDDESQVSNAYYALFGKKQ